MEAQVVVFVDPEYDANANKPVFVAWIEFIDRDGFRVVRKAGSSTDKQRAIDQAQRFLITLTGKRGLLS